MPLNIAGHAGATKADITLHEPKTGVTHTALDQTGSTASVTGDHSLGSALAVIVYQDAMDSTIATETALIDPPTGVATEISGSATMGGSNRRSVSHDQQRRAVSLPDRPQRQ